MSQDWRPRGEILIVVMLSLVWILWEKTDYAFSSRAIEWKRIEAFESKDQCTEGAKGAYDQALSGATGAPWETGRRYGSFKYMGTGGVVNLVLGRESEAVVWFVNYECWPDTVDPRR
jgi:hypothetical protein